MDRKVIEACVLLLGPHTRNGAQRLLQQLDTGAVRRAYRVIALASHPDAARRRGRHASDDGRRFIEAANAYETLMSYLLSRDTEAAPSGGHAPRSRPAPASPWAGASGGARSTGRARPAGSPRPGSTSAAGASARGGAAPRGKAGAAKDKGGTASGGAARPGAARQLFYRGPLPRKRLRLAEFLYYSGRVSWQSLIKAIVWQRSLKPKFGELARELRAVSSQDLARILASKLRNEQTGQAAQRLRLLTAEEVERVLRLQRARHRPIGRYFVENERMPTETLSRVLRELYRHNARWAGGA